MNKYSKLALDGLLIGSLLLGTTSCHSSDGYDNEEKKTSEKSSCKASGKCKADGKCKAEHLDKK